MATGPPAVARWRRLLAASSRLFLLLLLEETVLLCDAADSSQVDASFGAVEIGIMRYLDASGSEALYCTYVSSRFKQPPYGKENDIFRGVEFRNANESCDLGLERVSDKHVLLMLPAEGKPCPFEASLAQAVSARVRSLVVARNIELEFHKGYFTPGKNGTAPPQDIILGIMTLSTAEVFRADSAEERSPAAAFASAPNGPFAKLYLVELDVVFTAAVLCLMASSTVAIGAMWAGSTRKLLFLTQHRRTKPKDEQPRKEDADLDVVPIAKGSHSIPSLGLQTAPIADASQQRRQEEQQPAVRSRPRSSHRSKAVEDFPPSDDELLEEDITFAECPVDCKLITLFVLAIAVNLLVMYYFFNYLWPVMVGSIALGSMISLIIIFDGLAFLIPCASVRLPNVLFPWFVRSMELRHHVAIWLAIAIPITWLIYRKAEHAWILQNILGSSFAINIHRSVHLPNFKIITIICVLLFLDDIFMVFVTSFLTKDVSVMESVAQGVQDLPVLMRVPYFFPGDSAVCPGSAFMLGYGDIVVPGLAVSYCHSYEAIVKKGFPWYFLLELVCKFYRVTLQDWRWR
ncbi:uncharacterized protein LOC144094650 isoform X2 [Amblyomma americanum]